MHRCHIVNHQNITHFPWNRYGDFIQNPDNFFYVLLWNGTAITVSRIHRQFGFVITHHHEEGLVDLIAVDGWIKLVYLIKP